MMNKKLSKILLFLLAVMVFIALWLILIKFFSIRLVGNNLSKMRASLYGDVPVEKRILVAYGERIEHEIRYGPNNNGNDVIDYLSAGCDPNFCLNLSEGWQFQNPLMLFNTAALYVTWFEEQPFYPDVTVFNSLISAGANVNKYPYVWAAVFCHDNYGIYKLQEEFKKGYINEEEMEHRISCNLKDSNRVLKLFLDAGADVNKKGSPIPFSKDVCTKISEEKIQEYFNSPEATTPLYEAIKKGIKWESQVDLLLEYGATLDESCLKAAKLSGDEAMVEKIKKLLEK